MNEIEVYLLDDTEIEESYWIQKGFRPYIIVKVDNNYYNLTAYDYEELYRECKESILHVGYYCIDPNLILVKELTKTQIIFTLKSLYTNYEYFNKLKPENNINNEFELKRIY